MSAAPVYLDYNASMPMGAAVQSAVSEVLDVAGNASSVHGFGRRARRIVEDARDRVAALVGAAPAQVIFTSGATEANNQALRCVHAAGVAVSAIEHDSVLAAVPNAERLPVTQDGIVDLDAVEMAVVRLPKPFLVSVMLANNETGVIQPVADVAEIVHRHSGILHCDAVQGAGKIGIDMASLGADLTTISAHKMGGSQGVGALIVRDGLDIAPLIFGGGQERRRRGGTENLPGIAGFGVAAELAQTHADNCADVASRRNRLETEVRRFHPRVDIAGSNTERLCNTTCLITPGIDSSTQVMTLDLAGIAVSAGAACSSGKVAPSHVLIAMGYDSATAHSAIRISLGPSTIEDDIDRFLTAWRAMLVQHDLPASAA